MTTVAGSLSAYLLSLCCGRDLVAALWPDRVRALAAHVQEREGLLVSYVTLLRVAPFLPNAFVNVAAPVVGIPARPFALGTLLGSAPGNAVLASAGARLSQVMTWRDLYSRTSVAVGAGIAALALAPVYLRHRQRRELACPSGEAQGPLAGVRCEVDEVLARRESTKRMEACVVMRTSSVGESAAAGLHHRKARKGS